MYTFDFPVPVIDGKAAIFIGEVQLEDEVLVIDNAEPAFLYLFGGKMPVTVLGKPAWKLVFVVVEKSVDGQFVYHELAQHDSIMYQGDTDRDEYETVDMMRPALMSALYRKPKWKKSEASWPFYQGSPFFFVKQFFLDESFKETLSWDLSIFLFVFFQPGKLLLRVFTQDTSAQTAEDHYKLEEMMATFERHHNDAAVVEKLVKEGDGHFYDFVLEHKYLTPAILAILAQHGTTKKIRNEATKLLKQQSNDEQRS